MVQLIHVSVIKVSRHATETHPIFSICVISDHEQMSIESAQHFLI